MVDYGREDCDHVWRYRVQGRIEGDGPAICIECGAFGCFSDAGEKGISREVFFEKGGYESDANINGRWENPFVEKKKLAETKGLVKKIEEK